MEDGREISEISEISDDSGTSEVAEVTEVTEVAEVAEVAEVTGVTEVTEISELEPVIAEDEELNNSPPKNLPRKESFYDKIPLSKKQLDVIIVVLMVALVAFFIIGALIGNGLI